MVDFSDLEQPNINLSSWMFIIPEPFHFVIVKRNDENSFILSIQLLVRDL